MFFSLFKRKDSRDSRGKHRASLRDGDPTTTQSTTAATDTLSQREIARRTAEKIDEIESQMNLALPAKVVKGQVAPIATQGNTVVAARPEPALVQEDNLVVFAAAETPPKPAASTPVTTADISTSVMLGDTRSANALEVLSSGLLPVFEEASVLYGNKQSSAAAMILWQAIKEDRLGGQTEQAWKMLFELYQAAGRKPEFESLAIDYASRFESSPPTWQDDLAPIAESKPVVAHSSAIVFPDALDVHAMKPIESLQRALQRNRPAEVNLSMVRRVDEIGSESLLRLLIDIRKSSAKVSFTGLDELRIAVSRSIETGRRDPSDACWLLILEVLRFLGDQQAFEDAAIDYCVTYEVSPPSWEALPKTIKIVSELGGATTAHPPAGGDIEGDPDLFTLSGEIDGRPADLFKALKVFARERQEVVIDCRRLRRIDFVCAGEMLNEVAALRAAGKFIVLRDLSHLIACLMMVMGIHDLAELNLRTH